MSSAAGNRSSAQTIVPKSPAGSHCSMAAKHEENQHGVSDPQASTKRAMRKASHTCSKDNCTKIA
jgi:hypothetical protein